MNTYEGAAAPITVLAGAAVAGLDPAARTYSAPRWKAHERDYQATIVELCRIGEYHNPLHNILRSMITAADVTRYYDELVDMLHECLRLPGFGGRVDRLARMTADKVRLYYLAVPAEAIHETGREEAPVRSSIRMPSIRVVIPFRARPDQSLRLRNLHACLDTLHRQTIDRSLLHITLVESDEDARHQARFEAADSPVDRYLFHRDAGPFNKAAALNLGAAGASGDEVLCLLDADMLLAPRLLELAAPRVGDGNALLPYTDAFCLDPACSEGFREAVRHRLSPDTWSGYMLRRPPGGCVMVTAADFRALGGFDTRFTGWGGEDRDFVERLEARGRVERLIGAMVHLHHERPAMREDHDGIMRDARAKESSR